ncbi:MAG: type II toxin-antitoxin system PemK/MazF family toxin [Isosphaeraceae bacterium]
MRVGDIYWVNLPPRGGHAQAGRRPAIVAQVVEQIPSLSTVIVDRHSDPVDHSARCTSIPGHCVDPARFPERPEAPIRGSRPTFRS